MFCSYHRRHWPDLSPATRSTACRCGSNTNKIRTSVRPADPGRSSFMLWIFESWMVSTSGRPNVGPSDSSWSIAAVTSSAVSGAARTRYMNQSSTSSRRITAQIIGPSMISMFYDVKVLDDRGPRSPDPTVDSNHPVSLREHVHATADGAVAVDAIQSVGVTTSASRPASGDGSAGRMPRVTEEAVEGSPPAGARKVPALQAVGREGAERGAGR